jgi:hypothetical protein
VRRAPTRHHNIDFKPVMTKTSEIVPLYVVVLGERGYDSGGESYHGKGKIRCIQCNPLPL